VTKINDQKTKKQCNAVDKSIVICYHLKKITLPLTKGLYMANDNNKDRQRKFKSKMYDAGFKRIYFWVKDRTTKKAPKMDKKTFVEKATQLASKLSSEEQSNLFALIIKVIEGRKEVLKLRKKEKENMPGEGGGKKGRGQ
jgi:hypothetical protein